MSREMKDSGIAWIGEIPSHWKVSKIKNETVILDYLRQPISAENRNNTLGLYDYYGASGVIDKIDDYNVDDKVLLIGEDGANLVLRNLPLIYKAEGRFWVNNHAHIIKVREANNYEFMYFMLEAGDFYLYITGSAQPKLSQDNMKNFLIPMPSYAEQQTIADYLDTKCSEIDELISLQDKMIEELKAYKQSVITEAVTKGLNPDVSMKDSGIEWIGEIPEHWGIKALKWIVKSPLQYGANESGIIYDEKLPRYVRITDISNNQLREDIQKQSLTEAQAIGYILEDNDILFARSGGTVGKSFIYSLDYGRCAFAGYLIRAQINEDNHPKYIYYYTQSFVYEEWKKQIFIQATIQNIGADRYSLLDIPIPSFTEQQSIADYLDNKCLEIDSLIALKQAKIEELKEYKKSIIYEYVTGKKEVVA